MRIILEGVAGKRFGREFNLDVHSPNDAIRALSHRIPGFRNFMEGSHEFGIYWRVLTNRNKEGVNAEELAMGCSELILVPVITGSADLWKNILNIFLGIVLIVFAFTGFGLVAFGAVGTISAGIQSAIAALGFGLLFTGVAGLLAPGTPQGDKSDEGREADDAVFDGAQSTAGQGTPIPLLYGTFLCQSIPIVSSYIDDNKGYYLGVVSEGQIEGLAGEAKDNIYLNGARLASSSVDNIELSDGEQTAQPCSFVKSGGFHLSAGATLQAMEGTTPNQQVIRSFQQPYADTLKIRLTYGPCYCVNSYGAKGSSWTRYRDYTTRGKTNFLRYIVECINGNGLTFYSKLFEWGNSGPVKSQKLDVLEVDISGVPQPISIRITRLDRDGVPDPESRAGDEDSESWQWVKGDVTFVSADVMWSEKLKFPKSAMLGLKFDVSEFTQMPTIYAKCKGIKVPCITSSLSITYQYSTNPVYVLLDLITNPRYGAGGRSYTKTTSGGGTVVQPGIRMEDVDLGSFKEAANYCEDKGLTFNGVIDGASDAYDLIKGVASTFQGSLYYAGGKIGVVVDKPYTSESELKLFTESNVIQEKEEDGTVKAPCFTYEGVAKAARRTIANVSFVDPNRFYQETKVAVHHPEGIDRYGYRPVNIRALGCTSQAQAQRLGRYTIGSNIYNTETVTFRVASEGILLLPGDIVMIADGNKTPGTYGGRVSAASTTSVTIDRDLPAGIYAGYSLYVYGATGVCMKATVSGLAGRVLSTSAYSSTPTVKHSWILVKESEEKSFRRYRIQEISEEGNGTYNVVAIKYDQKKFEFMESETKDTLATLGTSLFSPTGTPKLGSPISFTILASP